MSRKRRKKRTLKDKLRSATKKENQSLRTIKSSNGSSTIKSSGLRKPKVRFTKHVSRPVQTFVDLIEINQM